MCERNIAVVLHLLLCSALLLAGAVYAEVLRVAVEAQQDVLGGQSFGAAGAKEKVQGTVMSAFDPAHPMNAGMVDLDKAPHTAAGQVEAQGHFMVLRPKQPQQAHSM